MTRHSVDEYQPPPRGSPQVMSAYKLQHVAQQIAWNKAASGRIRNGVAGVRRVTRKVAPTTAHEDWPHCARKLRHAATLGVRHEHSECDPGFRASREPARRAGTCLRAGLREAQP